MKQFLMICLSLSIVFPRFIFAANNTVEIDCVVTPFGEAYTNFINQLEKDTSPSGMALKEIFKPKRWWEFWVDESYKLAFSIDEATSQVLYPPWSTIEIRSESVLIREYFMGPCGEKTQCEALSSEYLIRRPNGELTGEQYAADESWAPHFKPGEKMWSLKGTCQTIDITKTQQ